jgi:hypothetical protein
LVKRILSKAVGLIDPAARQSILIASNDHSTLAAGHFEAKKPCQPLQRAAQPGLKLLQAGPSRRHVAPDRF